MKKKTLGRRTNGAPLSIKLAAAIALTLSFAATAKPQGTQVDITKSLVTIEVKKAGLFSAFGHDHVITAPLAGGSVDKGSGKAELRWKAAALVVSDPGISDKDRAEIQSTMIGPMVLDSGQYHEIVFRSKNADSEGGGVWNLHGSLTLHDQTRPVTAEVREVNGHFVGTLRIRQTDFGIQPVKIAGGTVRVKDEIEIKLDIQLAP